MVELRSESKVDHKIRKLEKIKSPPYANAYMQGPVPVHIQPRKRRYEISIPEALKNTLSNYQRKEESKNNAKRGKS